MRAHRAYTADSVAGLGYEDQGVVGIGDGGLGFIAFESESEGHAGKKDATVKRQVRERSGG